MPQLLCAFVFFVAARPRTQHKAATQETTTSNGTQRLCFVLFGLVVELCLREEQDSSRGNARGGRPVQRNKERDQGARRLVQHNHTHKHRHLEPNNQQQHGMHNSFTTLQRWRQDVQTGDSFDDNN